MKRFLLFLVTVLLFASCKDNSPAWHVEAAYIDQWENILLKAGEAGKFLPVKEYKNAASAKNGFIISRHPATGKTSSVMVYKELNKTMKVDNSNILALDPWMIFRKSGNAGLSYNRVTSAGEGTIYLAGKEPDDVSAWAAQFLQESPGVFPTDQSTWQEAETDLFLNRIFQGGADTYTWDDLWFRFNHTPLSWFYAPLSYIRNMPGDQTDTLAATLFPLKQGETRYGIQAETLWVTPAGETEEFKPLLDWLLSANGQTIIANELGWIPANPQGKPFNAVCKSAQLAWLRSGYVWDIDGGI
jgi:hypothetical protein